METTGPSRVELCTVHIQTTLDAEYVFPDVPKKVLTEVISRIGSVSAGDLVLVNASKSCLTIRREIIKTVKCNQTVVWSLLGVSDA